MESPWKLVTLDFTPPCFTQEQFSIMYQDYIESYYQLQQILPKMTDEMDFDGFAGIYNYFLLHSLFISQFTKNRIDPTIHSAFNLMVSFFGSYDKMLDKIRSTQAKWMIMVVRKSDAKPQLLLLNDSYQGIFYLIPILAIDLEPHIWANDYSNITAYFSQVIGYFKWDKIDERLQKVEALSDKIREINVFYT
jgi:superoxide dismutase